MSTMTKKRVAELEGAQLDWAVGIAQGWSIDTIRPGVWKNQNGISVRWTSGFSPSVEWRDGGQIIERERIMLVPCVDGYWEARTSPVCRPIGDTPLIAAMRAFVASKLGDEVEVPE